MRFAFRAKIASTTELEDGRYGSGDWEEGRLRDAVNPDDDSGSDVFGDFEDIETGREFGGDGDAATATALKAIQDEAKARQDDKAAKKAVFDTEYDVGECPAKTKPSILCNSRLCFVSQ